jgi:cellulose synthase/poly-beta-1,6-N-acetylglucosamine synthase-like glycosyltransferase
MVAYLLFITASMSLLLFEAILTYGQPGFRTSPEIEEKPYVSILISIRNESHNIASLCHSLNQLDYPKDRFEILIGDDASSDNSFDLLMLHKPDNARLFAYSEPEVSSFGKLGVLKKLENMAKGEFLLFTDGDITFNPQWIRGMLFEPGLYPQLHLGITWVRGFHWFHQLQNMDWIINQTIIAWFSQYFPPLTAWGNNMIIDKSSFQKIQGFSDIEDTIVEDVALVRKVTSHSGRIVIKASKETLCKTNPSNTFRELIHQRARWMRGVSTLPILMKLGLIIKLAFLPCVIGFAFINPWALILIPLKALLLYMLARRLTNEVQEQLPVRVLIYFEIYEFITYFSSLLVYLLPFKTVWKGRKY